MNALAPLFGVLVLSGVLVVNFFRAAWRLGILRAFGRRHPLRWRALAAGALAACLPLVGALIALVLIPADNGMALDDSPASLALELAGSGWLMHLLNDHLVIWGGPPSA
ncbi:hypothetical protein [Aquabacterium sp.]|jgi:hypothetical protein|uniref:hypothetical protein n=1 Tax=Aquabacterium sp. TaxID=1872578 RepID=UPI0025BEED5D|nr:hypothetical protein [Aquabacterium sp.]